MNAHNKEKFSNAMLGGVLNEDSVYNVIFQKHELLLMQLKLTMKRKKIKAKLSLLFF